MRKSWIAGTSARMAEPPITLVHVQIGTDAHVGGASDTMQVHGLEGLYVVDASVMPYAANANIYSPTMMIAEKAADLLNGATPFPNAPLHCVTPSA
jgi:choline dehydrogenase